MDAITVPLDFEYNLFGDYSIMINLAYQDIKRGTQTDYEIAPDSKEAIIVPIKILICNNPEEKKLIENN